MSSSKERIQKALDSLLYLPHLKAQNEQANLASLGSPGSQEGGKGRVWDRGDLFRRLATFKAGTWFCKPEPISPVECARRGWLNTGVDMLTCEVGLPDACAGTWGGACRPCCAVVGALVAGRAAAAPPPLPPLPHRPTALLPALPAAVLQGQGQLPHPAAADAGAGEGHGGALCQAASGGT